MASSSFEDQAYRIKALSAVLIKLARRDFEKRLNDGKLGVTPLGAVVVQILSHHQMTLSDLGHHLMLASATLIPVVDSLEKSGLVKRNADPSDRRRAPLSLTPKGKRLNKKIPFVDAKDLLVVSLGKLGEEKTEQLASLLEEMALYMSRNPFIGDNIRMALQEKKEKNGRENRDG
ncbi:MAG: MarR family transcriptional regulator [Candidatus Diapherotrites archaeon]|uniref:MarR family transcriptional regulator n=1 Tax=Candidatus Iainarchaeum sp. TaxID=3101447 RepID=A0A8T4L547_9ARCH|nr:MarR family transcriptional regulator [Candidatus Diapherotrites archaeon]